MCFYVLVRKLPSTNARPIVENSTDHSTSVGTKALVLKGNISIILFVKNGRKFYHLFRLGRSTKISVNLKQCMSYVLLAMFRTASTLVEHERNERKLGHNALGTSVNDSMSTEPTPHQHELNSPENKKVKCSSCKSVPRALAQNTLTSFKLLEFRDLLN